MSSYVELFEVKKVYPVPGKSSGVVVVDQFNMRMKQGEVVALLGHSGCGKSTVLTMVAGLNKLSGGGIIVAGREVTGPGPDRAVVFQAPCLLPWLTALGNVKLGVDELFQMLDSGGKGYITKEDAAAGLDALAQKLAEAKSKTSGGGESTGGGGGAKGAGASGASSTSTDYDPKDTNQDGTVSLQEELAYVMTHYAKTDAVEISTQETSTETYA